MINFDNIGSTQLLPDIRDFLIDKLHTQYGDKLNFHSLALKTQAEIEQARILIANAFNVAPATIRFTHSGTEANNLIINWIQNKNTSAVITSHDEDLSVLRVLQQKAKLLDIPLFFVENTEDSGINLKHLKKLLQQNNSAFVSLAHVNRLTGRLLPLRRTAELCHKFNSVFHTDIAMTAGKLSIDLQKLDIDFASASAHKIGGLRGAGFIYFKRTHKLSSIFAGNNDEYGLSLGTENLLGIISMAQALDYNLANYQDNLLKINELKSFLHKKLLEYKINFQSKCFQPEHFLPHIINISLPKIKNLQNLLIYLDMNNIAIGYEDLNKKNLIISFSEQNTFEEITTFVKILKKYLRP